MEFYKITIDHDNEIYHFQVGEFLHQDGESCKYKVFRDGMLIASFEPDKDNILHVCQNPFKVDEKLLHLLADQIEVYHTHNRNQIAVQEDFNGLGTA